MTHIIRMYNGNNPFPFYQESFKTAADAYAAYVKAIEDLKKNLIAGHEVAVARFNEERMMTIETVTGTKEE